MDEIEMPGGCVGERQREKGEAKRRGKGIRVGVGVGKEVGEGCSAMDSHMAKANS